MAPVSLEVFQRHRCCLDFEGLTHQTAGTTAFCAEYHKHIGQDVFVFLFWLFQFKAADMKCSVKLINTPQFSIALEVDKILNLLIYESSEMKYI